VPSPPNLRTSRANALGFGVPVGRPGKFFGICGMLTTIEGFCCWLGRIAQ
jgi:hypothetical protein